MQKPQAEYDTSSWFCEEDNFDPRGDFLEFLETAKMHASEMSAKGTDFPNTTKHESKASEVRKRKKPWTLWKKALFFWSKSKKKVSAGQDPSSPVSRTTSAHGIAPPFKRSAKSGPITSSTHRMAASHYASGRPTSGPLGFGGWFTPTESKELDIPYMCLNHLDQPNHLKDFGPIYLVT